MQCPEFDPQYNKIKNKRSKQKANHQLLIKKKKKKKKDIISLRKNQHWDVYVRTQAAPYLPPDYSLFETGLQSTQLVLGSL